MTTIIRQCIAIAVLLIAHLNGVAQGTPAQEVDTRSTAVSAAVSHCYYVYYSCSSHGWRLYGRYDCRDTAYVIAGWLERQGYRVRVVCD
jgi:hypothetical protein